MHLPSDEDNKPPPSAYKDLDMVIPAASGPLPSPVRPPQSSQQVARVESPEREKSLALQTISEVNPVGASVLVLNDQYYSSVLQQAQRSFLWALCAAIIGLLFFLAAVAFLLFRQPQNISYVSVICGALVEVISALNFYLYGRASQQLTDFHLPLERTQRFILANNICEMLQDSKEEIRAKLVLTLVNSPATSVNEGKKVVNKRDHQSKANDPYGAQKGGYQQGGYQQPPVYGQQQYGGYQQGGYQQPPVYGQQQYGGYCQAPVLLDVR